MESYRSIFGSVSSYCTYGVLFFADSGYWNCFRPLWSDWGIPMVVARCLHLIKRLHPLGLCGTAAWVTMNIFDRSCEDANP